MKRESTEELRERLLADEQVHSMIAMRAYEIFQIRGGAQGHEADDWFQAEAEILKFVIEEEVRRNDAHSPGEQAATVETTTRPSTFPPYDTTEKRMEIFTIVETEAAPSAASAAKAEMTRGEIAARRAATPAKTSSREESTKSASRGRKAEGRVKSAKGSDKKASGKIKGPKKSGKTKHSKHRSPEMEKEK